MDTVIVKRADWEAVQDELASLRARLAEVDSWKQGAVPEGVDRIEVEITEPKILVAHRTKGDCFYASDGNYVHPYFNGNKWRPLKEGE